MHYVAGHIAQHRHRSSYHRPSSTRAHVAFANRHSLGFSLLFRRWAFIVIILCCLSFSVKSFASTPRILLGLWNALSLSLEVEEKGSFLTFLFPRPPSQIGLILICCNLLSPQLSLYLVRPWGGHEPLLPPLSSLHSSPAMGEEPLTLKSRSVERGPGGDEA